LCLLLVALMGPGVKWRQSNAAAEFRQMAGLYNAEVSDLPDGAFKSSGTGIKPVMVKIEVPYE
jgi:hypothetical protein